MNHYTSSIRSTTYVVLFFMMKVHSVVLGLKGMCVALVVSANEYIQARGLV